MAKSKIDYNVKEASWKFLILKVVEISIVLLIIFGFYFVGVRANNLSQTSCDFRVGLHIPCPHTDNPTAVNLWGVGVMFCLLIIFTLVMWLICLLIVAGIIYLIIYLNWKWATKWAETYESRKRGVINKEKSLRQRWDILEDDIVTVKKNLKISEKYGNIKFVKRMKPYEGQTGRVLKLDTDDHTYKLSINGQDFWWTTPMLKLKERRENPFLIKLNSDPKWKNESNKSG